MTLAPVDRKAEIVDAAAALFARRGFDAVGMDDIAEALGMSGPALYWHFAGKDELLIAVLAAAADHVTHDYAPLAGTEATATAKPGAGADDAVVTPAEFARVGFASYLDHPHHATVLVRDGHRAQGQAATRRRQMFDQLERVVARMIPALPDGLTREQLQLRRNALVGPALVLALDQPSLPRRRIHELGTQGGAGILAAPPRPPLPVPPPTSWRPTRSRREQILAAARELFETRGFHAVTVNDIGEAIGLRGPSIYRHFGSKRELLAAAWDREAARVAAGTLDALRQADSASDALARLARALADVMVDNRALVRRTYFDVDERPDHIGTWSTWRPFVVEAWGDVVVELRPDLAAAEARFAAQCAFAAVVQAAVDSVATPAWVDEIAQVGVAFATTTATTVDGMGPGDS